MLLPRGHLGEASRRLGFQASPLDRALLYGLELGLALLLLERTPLPVGFLRLEARLLLLLLSANVVEAALLFFASALLGLDLLLLLATLRIAQNVLDGGHHRRFLPFRHVALSSRLRACSPSGDRARRNNRVPTCRPLRKREKRFRTGARTLILSCPCRPASTPISRGRCGKSR